MTSAVPVARGWKEQLRRVGELALLGIVAVLASLPVVTVGAVVATLSTAVGHWADHDDLPSWRAMGAEFVRRLLPGVPVSVVGVLAVLVVSQQVAWLRDGVVPGGGAALAAFGVAVAWCCSPCRGWPATARGAPRSPAAGRTCFARPRPEWPRSPSRRSRCCSPSCYPAWCWCSRRCWC
jgi:hypothetical protein